jgi:glycosyltransferase involved in cell wall biosynthesis
MAQLTSVLVRRSLRRTTQALGGSVSAAITTWPLLPTLGSCGERRKVYWAQDDFVAGAGLFGRSAGRLRRGEAALAARADVIVASNPVVADAWRQRGYKPLLIPFGCDTSLFASSDGAPLPTDVVLAPPVIGFIGYLGDRIDIRLLEAIAERGRSLLLVGPRHPRFALDRIQSLLARPNVQWVGPKPFDQLPSYQRVIDVGIVPYTQSAFNLGSFPLKTLEYLAAGRAVVATNLPAISWLNTELIAVATEPTSFADAVDRALRQPRTAEIVAQRQAFAARHSWAVRTAEFATALGLRLLPDRAQTVA